MFVFFAPPIRTAYEIFKPGVMQSSRYVTGTMKDARKVCEDDTELLKQNGFEVIRQKIEAVAGVTEGEYFWRLHYVIFSLLCVYFVRMNSLSFSREFTWLCVFMWLCYSITCLFFHTNITMQGVPETKADAIAHSPDHYFEYHIQVTRKEDANNANARYVTMIIFRIICVI